MKSKKRLLFKIIMVLLIIGFAETGSFIVTKYLHSKGVYYNPWISDSYEDYLLKRDNILGWPPPAKFGKKKFDISGSRRTPAYPDEMTHPSCISLYGDSFTWSSEVTPEYAWGNVLSTLVGCRVANYGVGGYGSDQAYMRFKQNIHDNASVVFMNHLSENILRNVNQFRDLLYPGKGLGFKPRYILDEKGDLELLSLPTFEADQYEDVVLHPEKYFDYEYFYPGGPSGLTVASFPFTYSVIKGLQHFHIQAKLRGEPWYMEFYRNDHSSRALQVTTEVLKAFHNDALERNKIPIVTIIPTGKDLLYFAEHQVWPYNSLIESLSFHDISVFNFGAEIMNRIGDNDPCMLFDNCSAHYNEEGYEMLAEIAFNLLKERNLLDSDQRQIHQAN